MLLACAAPAAAQPGEWLFRSGQPLASPVPLPSLAPGEQRLELGSLGYVTAPADRVELTAVLRDEGADPDNSRRRLAEKVDRLRGALVAIVPSAAVRSDVDGTWDDARRVFDVASEPAGNVTGAMVTIRLDQVAMLSAVRSVLTRFGGLETAPAVYSLVDRERFERAARLDALARARTRADLQAGAGGMRVLRILRVSEHVGMDIVNSASADIQALRGAGRPLNPRDRSNRPEMEVLALLNVDFAVAPR